MYKEKLKKKQWSGRWEKIRKALKENKLTVMIRRLLWQFSLYWKFMCTGKDSDRNKKKELASLLYVSLQLQFAVFLIAEKLLSLWLCNFCTFSLFVMTVLWKIKRNCMGGPFFFADL